MPILYQQDSTTSFAVCMYICMYMCVCVCVSVCVCVCVCIIKYSILVFWERRLFLMQAKHDFINTRVRTHAQKQNKK